MNLNKQFHLCKWLASLRRRAATEFSRGLKPIGIYTSSGFPESHHRQVVDRSIPTYKTLKNPPESHHRQVVDRSIPTSVFRCRARRLDLNDPPPAGGGIAGNLSSPCRLGLNDPPAPAGGILLNIICVDINGFQPTAKFSRRSAAKKRPHRLKKFGLAATLTAVLSFANACAEAPSKASDLGAASRPATLAADEPEPPRVYLDTTYTPPKGGSIEVKAGGDFQAALNKAKPGDVITLEAGATFSGNFTLPNRSGSGQSEWIVIRSSTPDSNLPPPGARVTPSYSNVLPKIVSPNSEPAIKTSSGAHHYRFIGLEIGHKAGSRIYAIVDFDGGQTSISQVPHDLIVDRCYIHGNPSDTSRRGVALNSASTAVIDSYISECHESGADSQAIAGWNGPGPFKIVNNYLEGAGENFLLGGADSPIKNLVPSDIEFRNNHVVKPLKWKLGHPSYAGVRWSVKNLFELKNAQRALIDSNVFEYNWAESQNGFAILFTPRNQGGRSPWSVAQDVTFSNNVVRHSGGGFNISGPDDEAGSSLPSRRILIRNNLIEDIDGKAWGGDGKLFQIVGGAEYVTIDHNTGFATGNILTTESAQVLNVGLVFTNNIVAHNAYGVIGTDTGVGLSALSRWWKSYVFKKNVIVGGQASNYPPNNYFINSFSEVGFVDMAKGDYRLSSSSSYRNAGADGKNIGCNLNNTHR